MEFNEIQMCFLSCACKILYAVYNEDLQSLLECKRH